MPTESKTPNTDDGTIIAPCRGCGIGILSRPHDVMWAHDEEGNSEIVMSFNQCDDCEAELEKRIAEGRVRAAQAKAKYEKTLADLRNSIPKKTENQIGLDMGLDSHPPCRGVRGFGAAEETSLPKVNYKFRTLRPRLPAIHRRLRTPLRSQSPHTCVNFQVETQQIAHNEPIKQCPIRIGIGTRPLLRSKRETQQRMAFLLFCKAKWESVSGA